MPKLKSFTVVMIPGINGLVKLGQPVPDSNFASLANRGALHPAQWKTPRRCSVSRTEEHARSVEWPRRIAYCSGVNCFFHSASDFSTLGTGARSSAVGFNDSIFVTATLCVSWAWG